MKEPNLDTKNLKALKCQPLVGTVRANLMDLLDSSLNHIKKIKTEYVKSRKTIFSVIKETVEGLSTHE